MRRVGERDLKSGTRTSLEADGLVTAIGRVGVMVLVADCLPVALGTRGAVAMVHAGWRGLAGGVLEAGVRVLRDVAAEANNRAAGADEPATAATAPAEPVVAVIGPCAGVCCYEAGEEVHAAFGHSHRQGRRLDLCAHARDRLVAAGVSRVEAVERCTICDERLFSYRRDGERAGRQAGVAWLS